MRKVKMGRPPVDKKGKVLSTYAPPELVEDVELIMQYTGGTISEFVRDAIKDAAGRAMNDYAGKVLKNGNLNQYTGGAIETPKR